MAAVSVFIRLQLRYAGYNDEEIAKLGNLAELALRKVLELLDSKSKGELLFLELMLNRCEMPHATNKI